MRPTRPQAPTSRPPGLAATRTPLAAALADHPPPPGEYRVDEKREPEEGAEGEGPGEIPERTGVCAGR